MIPMIKGHSIVGFGHKRADSDFYPTPPDTTMALMLREKFTGEVWEPACGDGSMSQVIEQFNPCFSSDIRKEGVYGQGGVDFLKIARPVNNIITNPPYKLAGEFVEHSLKCANKKVAMLLKLVFLEGTSRYRLFKNTPLRKVYVFCKRQNIRAKSYEGNNSSMIAYAWFVWEKGYLGKPEIDWIRETKPEKVQQTLL